MMNVLAIETSTANCAVSLVGDQVDFSLQQHAPQQHAQLILPMVEQVLAQAGLLPKDIDVLAFGEGPGAFTGLRIAAGVIQGLALGWDKPVIAVSSLHALAYQAFMQSKGNDEARSWLACLDARMGEVYTQFCSFSAEGQLLNYSTAELVKADMISPQKTGYGVGDIKQAYPQIAALFDSWVDDVPNAHAIAQLARQRPEQALSLNQQMPQPIYLRPSVS